jgi:hypothetical protein
MGENMGSQQKQRGLTIVGFIFVAAVILIAVMIGFRVLPSYIEYYTVQKVMAKTLQDQREGFSVVQFRKDFDLKAGADYIESVRGTDIDVQKIGNEIIATATWAKKLPLVANVSLLLEFEATASK